MNPMKKFRWPAALALAACALVGAATVHASTYPSKPIKLIIPCLLYTSPSPRDLSTSRMPSSA